MLNSEILKVLDKNTLEKTLGQVFDSIRRTIPKMGTEQPKMGLPDLTYLRCDDTDWVNGFWPGQLWLAFAFTGEEIFKQAGISQRAYFTGRLDRPQTLDHDLGFLYSLSTVAEYKLTGNPQTRESSLRAADLLITRFNPKGRYIQAWNISAEHTSQEQEYRRGQMIIDCMENLGLLYWATEQTGQSVYRDIAIEHARTAARYLVRQDGSTYHTYIFNPQTGDPLGGRTAQGHADESHWSRGHAWAIHGFTLSYERTGQAEFLETACELADYVVKRLGEAEAAVPDWDYKLPPEGPFYKDSSAAAITAAGLFYLASILPPENVEGSEGKRDRIELYHNLAARILASLIQDYTTFAYPEAEGLLLHGASHIPLGYTDNMLPYGDYFFVEALLRASGYKEFFW